MATSGASVQGPVGEPAAVTRSRQRCQGEGLVPEENDSILALCCSRIAVTERNSDICKARNWHAEVSGMRRRQRKRETTEEAVYGCAAIQYEGVGGVGGGMLIGLWGAEPRQINSVERIVARADIRPPPHPRQHTFSSYYSY